MTISDTAQSHLARVELALSGCRRHAEVVPAAAEAPRAELTRRQGTIRDLLAEHERMQQNLAQLVARIGEELRDTARTREELLGIVEEALGGRDPRIRDFRPASEARLHAPRLRAQPSSGAAPTGGATLG